MSEQLGGLLGAAFEASTIPSLVLDSGTRVVAANDAYVAISARTRAALLGTYAVDFIHADDLDGAIAVLDRLLAGAPAARHRRRLLRGDGTLLAVSACSSLFEYEGARYMLIQILEHGARSAPHSELVVHAAARTVLTPSGDAGSLHDREGRIVLAPLALAERLGRDVAWLAGRRLTDPELGAVTIDGQPLGPDADPVIEAISGGSEVVRTIGLTAADGGTVWYSVRAGTVAHLERIVGRAALREVTDLIEAQREIEQLAAVVERELAHQLDHDDLTGLKTRRALIDLVDEALQTGAAPAVVFIDLDRFKQINDDLGHLAGDEVLEAAAAVLAEITPVGATLGRAGGDEFVLLARSADDAELFAQRVRDLTARPEGLVTVRGRSVGASVGVADHYPGDTRSDLFARADAAMYRAKHRSRESSHVG